MQARHALVPLTTVLALVLAAPAGAEPTSPPPPSDEMTFSEQEAIGSAPLPAQPAEPRPGDPEPPWPPPTPPAPAPRSPTPAPAAPTRAAPPAPDEPRSPARARPTPAHHTPDLLRGAEPSTRTSRPAPGLQLGSGIEVAPFVAVAGGLYYEQLPDQPEAEAVLVTPAVSRFGLRGRVGEWVSFQSEFEATLGASAQAGQHGPHGASVWEGMAALSVRNQYVQHDRWGWLASAGIVTDPSSVDFVSGHVADLLLTDHHTKDPLTRSGFNRGRGIFSSFDFVRGLHLGASDFLRGLHLGIGLNAGNPTSTTGTAVIGGQFNVYSRFYLLAASNVGRSSTSLPGDGFHTTIVTPSLLYRSRFVDVNLAAQFFEANTNTESKADELIHGLNLRASVRVRLPLGPLRATPFFNVARTNNDVVEPDDITVLSGEEWNANTWSVGIDLDQAAGPLGVGVWLVRAQGKQGDAGSVARERWLNIGASYRIGAGTVLGVRFATFTGRFEEQHEENRSFYTTLRLEL